MAPRTVLLVDPHRDSRVVYAVILARSGFRVLEAEDDAEGLRLARTERPDVIVTELFPWSPAGKTLPRRFRETPETAHIPVIAATAHLLLNEWMEELRDACARVLLKPVGPREILDEVARLVPGGAPAAVELPPLAG